MKLSRLKQIIKEEYYNVIKEGFADPEIRKLAKMGGLEMNRWRNFFRSFAKTHNIAWDRLPKGTLNKSTNMNDPLIKDGLAFWIIENDKPNPYGGDRYFDRTLRKGVMAVTLKGKVQYYHGGSGGDGVGSKGGYKQGQAIGRGVRGTLQLKKLKELADHVMVMDFENFRSGTKALKAKRAELKLGKDEFKDSKAWKQANLNRYKQILAARVGTRDQVDALVAKAVKLTNAAVEEAMEVPKLGRYDNLMTTLAGNEVELRAVTYIQGQILQQYARYIQYENQEEKEKDTPYSSNYYAREKKATALDIKNKVREVETGKVRY